MSILSEKYEFSSDKNRLLIRERGISFEDVIAALDNGRLLDSIDHKNPSKYSGQKIYIVEIERYTYLIPFVRKDKNTVFLKTIFPSRKITKQYLGSGGYDMKKNTIPSDSKLDPEEQALQESVERGEWKSTTNANEEEVFARKAAANFLRKDERITLRLSSADLFRLKQKAAYKGLPYQTFIASVLHEYAAGHFQEVSGGDK